MKFRFITSQLYPFIGKFLENQRMYQRVEICRTQRRFHRLVSDPTFRSGQILSTTLFVAKRAKNFVCLSKPIYIG